MMRLAVVLSAVAAVVPHVAPAGFADRRLDEFAQGAPVGSGVYRPGELARLRGRSTTDLAYLDVRAVRLAVGARLHEAPAHADAEELVIVTGGTVRVAVGGITYELGPGSVALMLPGDAHRIENAGPSPATCHVFVYRAEAPADPERGRAAGGSFVVDWTNVAYLPSAIGGRRNIFDRPTAMFRRFEMHVSTLHAGRTNHAAHTHRAEEFVLMLEGQVRMLVGASHAPATAGDVVFLASQVPHALDNTGDGPTTYYAFQGQ